MRENIAATGFWSRCFKMSASNWAVWVECFVFIEFQMGAGTHQMSPRSEKCRLNLNLMIPNSNVSRCRCRRERYLSDIVACGLQSDVLFQELFDVLKVPVEQQRLLHGAMASIETGGGFAVCHACCFTFSAFANGFTATIDFEHGDYISASYVFHLHSHNIFNWLYSRDG